MPRCSKGRVPASAQRQRGRTSPTYGSNRTPALLSPRRLRIPAGFWRGATGGILWPSIRRAACTALRGASRARRSRTCGRGLLTSTQARCRASPRRGRCNGRGNAPAPRRRRRGCSRRIGAETGTATGAGGHIGHAPRLGNATGATGKAAGGVADTPKRRAGARRRRRVPTGAGGGRTFHSSQHRQPRQPEGMAGARRRSAHGLAPRLGSSPRPRLAEAVTHPRCPFTACHLADREAVEIQDR